MRIIPTPPPLVRCSDDGVTEVLCVPCADTAGYPADTRTPWTDAEVNATVDEDADGKLTCGPTSCQNCGEGEP